MNFKQNLREALILKRPNLSTNSLQSYVSTLSNLPKKISDDFGNISDPLFFSKDDIVDKIIDHLFDVESRKRKSILSPLYVLTQNEKYRNIMQADIKIYEDHKDLQIKSKKEDENWMEWDEILKIYDNLKFQGEALIKMKLTKYSKEQTKLMTDYILLSMYVLIPPRRLVDFATMKIRNFNNDDNHINMKTKKLNFATYKTSKKYGTQIFNMPKELLALIKKWMKVNDSDYLLIEKLMPSELNKKLHGIFKPKKISVNMLRHIFLTDYYNTMNGMPSIIDMKNMASMMGHSIETALQYIKKD